jgi:hypothetical protein
VGHHPLHQGSFADEVAGEEHQREQPVDHRRLPHDEDRIVQGDGQPAEHHQQPEGGQVHLLDPAVTQPAPTHLDEGHGNRDAGGHVDALELVGDEEDDDREQVDQELHGVLVAWGRFLRREVRRAG